MQKLFSFRSMVPNNSSSNPVPLAHTYADNDMVFWDKTLANNERVPDEGFQIFAQSLKDSTLKSHSHFNEGESSSNLVHRRILSFSTHATNGDLPECKLSSFSDRSRSPSSCGDLPHHAAVFHMQCYPFTPERYTRSERDSLIAFPHSQATEKLDSPKSSRSCQFSTGSSPNSSPIRLRCRASHLPQLERNKVLDQYIDRENMDIKSKSNSRKKSFETRGDYCLENNEAFPRRAPRAHSTDPGSPTCSREDLITNSFGEDKDSYNYASKQENRRDDQKPISPPRHAKKIIVKPMHTLHGKIALGTHDYDLETGSTIEDIYVDSSQSLPNYSDEIAENYYTDQYTNYKKSHFNNTENFLQIQTQDEFLDNEDDQMTCSGQLNTDELLLKRLKDVDKTIKFFSDDELEPEESNGNGSNLSSLLQMIRTINRERKFLALELSSQMKHRLAERSAAKEHFRLAKLELDTRTRRLEKEKNELQFSLEKELDRRSSIWSMNLEKFKSDEQRLRERVIELAEQNVSLQREVSSLKGIEEDVRNKNVNSEMQLKDMKGNLEQVRTENQSLQQLMSKLEDKLNGLEEEKNCIRKIFGEKDRENKEFHKLVVRLQRICNEQDKTISGLRQGFSSELEKDDHVSRLQMEQLRLTGVERNLRREVDSCKQELELLRHENIGLLSRLQAAGNGSLLSSIKLDEEFRTRIDYLQTQGLSLLTDISHLNVELLEIIKHKQVEHGQETPNLLNGYSVFDFTIKSQSLRRQYENYKKSLQNIRTILDEKFSLATILAGESGAAKQSEDKLEFELKSEIILSRVLREKLCSKEGELENLQAELASSLRVHDVMQTEIQRLQDEVSYLTHKIKDMEIQMLRKDESIKKLQHDHQERSKELTASQSILMKVSEERNCMWEEVKDSREKIMLLNHEVLSLQKKIDDLDEDILTKEGQIAILKDSIDKPFDIIDSPTLVKQFSVE